MKISELSNRSGVPVGTIKFYIREELLPRGEITHPNQAAYGEEHIERLRLIGILKDTGGLSIATIKQVAAALDTPEPGGQAPLDIAANALSAQESPEALSPEGEQLRARIAALLRDEGWLIDERQNALTALARAWLTVEEHWHPWWPAAPPGGDHLEFLRNYARVAVQYAEMELPRSLWAQPQRAMAAGALQEIIALAVLGTIVFEPVIRELRRLAHCSRAELLQRDA